jgi:hypothetical protein
MNIVDRAKNIMFNPKQEWEVVKAETVTTQELYTQYAIILAAIPAIAGFLGYIIFGYPWAFGSIKIPIGSVLIWAILTYIQMLASVFIMSFIVDALAPSFGSTKNIVASTKVVVYSFTPAWVAGIFNIVPALSFIAALAGIYGLVLMYWGLQRVKDVSPDKMVAYFVVIIIAAIVVSIVLGLIVTSISFGSYMVGTGF